MLMLDGLGAPLKSQAVALTSAAVFFMQFLDVIFWRELVTHPGKESNRTHMRYMRVWFD